MTQILLWTAKFGSGATCSIMLEAEQGNYDYSSTAISISYTPKDQAGASIFRFPLRTGWTIRIPKDLTAKTSDATLRTLSWDEISEATANYDVIKVRKNIEDLRQELSHLELDATAFASIGTGFFNIHCLSGQAFIYASMSLDIPALRPPAPQATAAGATSDEIALTAIAEAEVQAKVLGASCTARARITVDINQTLPRFGLQLRPANLPGFELTLPKFDFPDFILPATLPALDLARLLPVNLPLDAHIVWTPGATPAPQIKLDPSGDLSFDTGPVANGALFIGPSQAVTMTGFSARLSGGAYSLVATFTAPTPVLLSDIELNSALTGPFIVRLVNGQCVPQLQVTNGVQSLICTLKISRLEIRAREDPDAVLALAITLDLTCDPSKPGTPHVAVTGVRLLDPCPIDLLANPVDLVVNGAQTLYRFVSAIPLPTASRPDLPDMGPLLDRLDRLVAAALRWLARQAGAIGRTLAGLGSALVDLLAGLMRDLRALKLGASTPGAFVVEIWFEAGSFTMRHILLAPAYAVGQADANDTLMHTVLGVQVKVPTAFRPALLYDLKEKYAALLLFDPGAADVTVSFSTDLWLAHTDGRAVAAPDAQPDDDHGARSVDPLVCVTAKLKADTILALAVAGPDGATFFRSFKIFDPNNAGGVTAQGRTLTVTDGTHQFTARAAPPLLCFDQPDQAVDLACTFNESQAERLLPFLRKSKPDDGASSGLREKLAQFITIKSKQKTPDYKYGLFKLTLACELNISDYHSDIDIDLILDPRTFQASINADKRIVIQGVSSTQDMLGLSAKILPKDNRNGPFPQYVLDFTDAEPRLSLAEEARIELAYQQVTSEGRGIVFRADTLVVSGDGIDLVAETDPDQTVSLAGVDTAFRFKSGRLAVKRGEIQSFSLSGSGALPPALMGEASADVHIAFGRGPDGRLVILSAGGALDRSADPIVCEATRFHFTLSKVGFEVLEDNGYHFLFRVTGSAEFKPRAGEFADGLLKYLGRVTLNLDNVPLVGDARVIARHIALQVAIDPPASAKLFDIFAFELRGIGFHPNAGAFGDAPAMSLSGQVKFGLGDVPRLDMEFHKMFIAPPAPGGSLPRVRFDGLTVGLSLGMARVRGTAIAVDDSMPSIYAPDVLPQKITPKGFLAAGTLGISGWPDMSASMGFLQLKSPQNEDRHAFFLFAQLNKLNTTIPTPLGTLYLREAGFGFGYRYTLAGLQRADTVARPQELVALLDEVSKYQSDLSNLRAWLPEPEGDRLTLAMRALFTITTASPEDAYDWKSEESIEKPPANLVLFDFVAALRSDLTFLLSGRAFLCVNYGDWVNGAGESWQQNPPLRGYMYISVPRRQFLARLVADPRGHIGAHPKLPDLLITAMRATRWSSTLYIDDTVFHQEFGWPYELGFTLSDENGHFGLTAEGGTVLRITDGAVLYGIAFRARGFACFSGRVGDSSLGASVEARADFAIDAKLIAYLSVARPVDTLFYGALTLDLTLGFRISVWLSFSVFGNTINLSASFSQSLTISVTVELVIAARSPMVGGKLSASIAVGAFGRTLQLAVGLSFNTAFLDETRQRVQRYMQLGLGVEHPDPEAGVPAPPPAPKRETTLKVGDDAVARAARDRQQLDASPPLSAGQPDGEKIGRKLGQSEFWALLFPTAAGDYILQLVPCDHTGLDAQSAGSPDLPASFYAPPDPAWLGPTPGTNGDQVTLRDADYTLSGFDPLPPGATMALLKPNGTSQDIAPGLTTQVSWNTKVSVEGGTPLRLWRVVRECFLDVDKGHFTEPAPKTLVKTQLPGDAAEVASRLAAASHQRDLLGPYQAAETAIHERRSAMIATICESAARLAATLTPAADIGLDARHFGLTFQVNAAALEALFGPTAREDAPATQAPPPSALHVRTEGTAADGSGSIMLFNPPSRFFRRAQPRLARAEGARGDGQVRLSWDLEPTWGRSQSVYDDPEFHLSRYQVERRFIIPGTRVPKLRVTTTKSGGQVYRGTPEGGGQACWMHFASRCQFVDDFSDLPDDWRAALRLTGTADDTQAQRDAWDAAFGKDREQLRIEYTIAAVDIAGTLADPEVIVVDLKRPRGIRPGLRRAALSLRYPHAVQAVGDAQVDAPVLDLLVEDSVVDAAAKAALAAGGDVKAAVTTAIDTRLGTLRLRAAVEAAAGGGTYGADAITEALGRPPVPDPYGPPRTGEADVMLRPVKDGEKPRERIEVTVRVTRPDTATGYVDSETRHYAIDPTADGPPGTLAQWLGIDNDPQVRAARIYLRPEPSQPPSPNAPAAAHWITADLVLTFAGARPDDAPAVEAVVEQFEHPLKAEFGALGFEDLDADGGPLVVRRTSADATLEKLLNLAETAVLDRQRDPAGRVAVHLHWNARAASLRLAGKAPQPDLAGLVAGYDLFSLDLDRVARPLDSDGEIARMSRYEGRVRLTPRRLIGQEPSTTGDFAQIEAFYPSAAVQTASGGRAGAALTPAESLVLWPQPLVRRMLLPNPPDEVIDDLFAKGAPAALRLTLAAGPADMAGMNLAVAAPWAKPQVGAQTQAGQPTLTLAAPDDSRGYFSPGEVRAALRCLYWLRKPASAGADPWDRALRETPAAFDRQTLQIAALDTAGTALALTEAPLALTSPLHAFLADTLDVLRFSGTGEAADHRRYEVVGEAAPQPKATDLAGLLDECPPQRDPYGWGLLRTLGLAASFRLYDADARDFVSAEATLRHVRKALAFVSTIYTAALPADGARLGAPFVDILMRPEGLLEVGSFDGGVPVSAVKGLDVVHTHGLSLVQIALRPAADRLFADRQPSADAHAPYLVNHLRVGAKPIDQIPAVRSAKDALTAAQTDWLAKNAAYKLKPDEGDRNARDQARRGMEAAAAALAKARADARQKLADLTLSLDPKTSHHVIADVIDLTSRLARPRQVTLSSGSLALALEEEKPTSNFVVSTADDQPVAMVRIIAWDKDGQALDKGALRQLIKVDQDLVSIDFCDAPMGAFAPLSGRRLALMAHGQRSGQDAPDIPAFVPVKQSLDDLLALTLRFNAPELKAIDQQSAFWTSLAAATERFLRHGPASSVTAGAAEPLIAFAAPLRPDPWRVVPDEDGSVGILLLEKDRFGHRRRYAVRPFGRYADLVEAVEGRRAPTLAGAFALAGGGLDLEAFADAVISRTEPVAPPVILSARRVDEARPGAPARPGELVELIIARHAEEALAEANRGTEAALAVRELGIGFWRQFAFESWGQGFPSENGWTPPDFAEAFGPFKQVGPGAVPPDLPVPAGVSIDAAALQVTSRRYPDLWRGAHIIRLRGLPYGFRLHALCYMASGAVVSKPVGTTVEEAHYVLGLPWPDAPPAPDAPTVFSPPTSEAPFWSVVEIDEGAPRRLAIDLPLVRVLDLIGSETRDLWFGTQSAPRMLHLPDPGVQYRFALEAGAFSSQPELDVIGRTSATPEGLYLVQYTGTRLLDPAVRARPKWNPTFGTFMLRLEAEIAGGALRPQDPPPVQPGAQLPRAATMIDGLTVLASSLAQWLDFAPRADHELQINVPVAPGPGGTMTFAWVQLRNDATAMRAAMATYVAAAPRDPAILALDAVLGQLAAINGVSNWPYGSPVGQHKIQMFSWPAGLPRPSGSLSVARIGNWVWPQIDDGTRARRRRLENGLAGASPAQTAKAILDDLIPAMRRRTVAAARARELAPSGTLAPHRTALETIAGAFEPLAQAIAQGGAGSTPIAGSIGLMRRHRLDVSQPPSGSALDAAFAALEVLDASGAMEALGLLEDAGTGTLSFLLPVRAAQPALTAFAALGRLQSAALELLILSRPPLDDELRAAQSVLNASDEAARVLASAAQEHLFGPGRHLVLNVIKGLAAPRRQPVERRP